MTAAIHSVSGALGLVLAIVGIGCVVAGAVVMYRGALLIGGCLAVLGLVILVLTL